MLDFSFQNEYPYNMKTNRKEKEMKVFKINCTNLKYGNTYQLAQLFSSEEKAVAFIEELDRKDNDKWWEYDYEIVEESVI